MHITLFGGTFDPPHNAHLTIAHHLIDHHISDQVWFVPVFQHPWAKKYDKFQLAPYHHRTEMIKLLIAESLKPRDRQANSLVLPGLGVTNSDQPHPFISELNNSAIIREIHVYGEVTKIGKKSSKKAQHHGFGTKLIKKAQQISKKQGFTNLAVISAIGTREYYQNRGFTQGFLYQHLEL